MEKDFMFFESFYQCVEDVRKAVSDEEANLLLMEIIYYGVHHKRSSELPQIAESVFISLKPYMDNSAKNKEDAVKRRGYVKNKKVQEK